MIKGPTQPDSLEDLTIVGIGSSAGGLEAVSDLVATLPTDIAVSYVVVQHMSPHHKSLMTELVARQTKLLVADVEDGIVPRANVIYITPPRTDVIFDGRKLRLVDPSPEASSPKPSVDRFLISLADTHGEGCMAVILSGTGSDGAYGIQAVREAGGITIAQDGESSKYDGMPNAAVQTGCVDLILSPAEIGTHLQNILSKPHDFARFRSDALEETPISDLLQILLARTRVDFREYKQTTIGRRIERRMVALNIDSQEEYTQFCRKNPHAVDALFKDLLISVTRFFRDKAEFAQLEKLLPELLAERGDGPLRIWIAGCATGEEAYSIAMLVSEALGTECMDLKSRVQIFATDIDKDALTVARKGSYAAAALNEIPPDLADKYLIRENDGVRVVDSIRGAILFSDHNVCQDPPFQRIDLLCCRNLLIYFGNALQQKVMSRFRYSLTNRGVMFLGTAESVAGSDELFTPHRDAPHFFRKRALRANDPLTFSMPSIPPSIRSTKKPDLSKQRPSTDRQFFEGLALSLGENSILVTDDYSIARVYGNVSHLIEMSGESNLRMHLDLLRSPLREEARSLVTISLKHGEHRAGVRHLLAKGSNEGVRLDVYPIIARDINERAALVVFTPIEAHQNTPSDIAQQDQDGTATHERIRVLEDEISITREALQQTIEELETSNEELQSLNEELQSTNEELQATNEELETSNEELQSTNEELITVNEELQVTTSELTGRTGELNSVLQSTPLAIVVTDSALQVTQATKSAADLFEIRHPTSNPHISQCFLPVGFPTLAPVCNEALTLGQIARSEFSTPRARYELICSPYFDIFGQVLGVTLIVTEHPSQARELEMILDTSQVYLMNRTRDGEILRISEASANMFGMTRDEAIGRNVYDLLETEAGKELQKEDIAFLDAKHAYLHGDVEMKVASDEKNRWLKTDRFSFPRADTGEPTIYAVGSDITDFVLARDEAEIFSVQLQLLQDIASIGYWSVDLLKNQVHWSAEVHKIHRTDPSIYQPDLQNGINFYHPDDRTFVSSVISDVVKKGGQFQFKKRIVSEDGNTVAIECHGLGVHGRNGEVVKIVGIFKEI